ncbi:MAG TPA: coproporphyrinogen III oxidase [Planctomycetaceae bacterium]|nr:coproporphyrinogen III oxidase [Planctomycetaceae bacterium]
MALKNKSTGQDAAADLPTWPVPQSAYIHVPFCRHRCGYCNFSVLPGRLDLADSFLEAIRIELQQLQHPAPVDTLFLGGGTPTRLSLEHLHRLFDLLDSWLPIRTGGELSVEANPEDINAELLDCLRSRGVNRISLGVQSFASPKLKILERTHDRAIASRAIEMAAAVIGNVSIDLIFAAPGETPQQWRDDVVYALSLPIHHLSTYSLTYEKGTQFWNRMRKGNLISVDEDDELQMYQDVRQMVSGAGWEHYEISNFAKPSFRCRHNLAYWQGRGWYAMGPGAAKFVDGRREVNHRSPTTYIRKVMDGQSPIAESEPIDNQQWACERAAFGIRMIDGVDLGLIAAETGVDVATLRQNEIARCVDSGWINAYGSHYQLTAAGILMADAVAAELL